MADGGYHSCFQAKTDDKPISAGDNGGDDYERERERERQRERERERHSLKKNCLRRPTRNTALALGSCILAMYRSKAEC